MATQKNNSDVEIMTRNGYEKLKNELTLLRTDKRLEIATKLEEARAFGDLSENAEYHAAKEEQEKLEGRISRLEYKLNKAKIVDFDDIDTSHANLGTTIKIQDMDSAKSYTYMLVGTEESDPKENKISVSSPVGKAIIGKSVGDEVAVRVPKGLRRLKLMEISAQRG
ncbi:MAG: transcription elongation factor GreA [Synergistaceae bacterium]|jgi:transcription elongation factor GreA|nr:transcription elongation factor GreA [Synergistaceae bacterium]